MPKLFYAIAFAGLLLWGLVILWAAHRLFAVLPEKGGRLIELAGTLLTLLPVGLDLFRKFYVRWHAPSGPSADPFSRWAQERVWQAFLGYERLYAAAVFLGVSLIALGFAVDLVKPG
jgi:hypothetical protein